MQIKLSSGETVTLHERWNRAMERKLIEAGDRNIKVVWNDEEERNERMLDPYSWETRYESTLSVAIAKIEKDGAAIPYSETWHDQLDKDDYILIENAIYDLRNGETVEDSEGKKKVKKGSGKGIENGTAPDGPAVDDTGNGQPA